MRRATVLLAQQLVQRAGTPAGSTLTAGCSAAANQLQQRASFAAHPPEIVPNPLQKIVPPIIQGVKAAVDGVKSGVRAVTEQVADGPATRGAIHYFADKVLLSNTFVEPSAFDLPKWASWLAGSGYTNKEGWDTLMANIKANVDQLSPSEVEALIPAINSVGRYEKELFVKLAEIVKARFTELETPGLCKVLPVYASHDHFDMELWDDVADAITYCNHYMAPAVAALPDVAATFAAFAKYEVDRGDLFVALSRNIYEGRIRSLSDAELKQVLGDLLGSFKSLGFFPDCTQALLVAGRQRAAALGPAETTLMAEVEAELRSLSPTGALSWLDGGHKDPHFHGAPFGSYDLWVMRDELIPQYYKPSDISPRPSSMTVAPPVISTGAAAAAPASS